MAPLGPFVASDLQEFKFLSEEALFKLSPDRIDAYYTRLNRWEQAKADRQRKKREQERKRLVERKKQEEERLAQEEEERRKTREEKERIAHGSTLRSQVSSALLESLKEGQRGKPTPGAQVKNARRAFNCVEVKPVLRQPKNQARANRSSGDEPSASAHALSEWQNNGQPLPYIQETEAGVAYPATALSPEVVYRQNPKQSFTSKEVKKDREKAKNYRANKVHDYFVAADGCIYSNGASWRPTHNRCSNCTGDGLHCWRRVIPTGQRCLRCSYKKRKCRDDSEDSTQKEPSSDPEPAAKRSKRQRAPDKFDDAPADRLRKRHKPMSYTTRASGDSLVAVLTMFEGLVRESARHHAALENLVTDGTKAIQRGGAAERVPDSDDEYEEDD